MNDLILYLWLIDIVSSISSGSKIVVVVCIIGLFLILVYSLSEAHTLTLEDVKHITNKYCKPVVIVLALMGFLLAVIPSKQTMYIALGLHTANQAMQQPQMAQVGDQAMRILQAKLVEYEKELAQQDKGEGKDGN